MTFPTNFNTQAMATTQANTSSQNSFVPTNMVQTVRIGMDENGRIINYIPTSAESVAIVNQLMEDMKNNGNMPLQGR